MKDYYHFCFVCPSCHVPYSADSIFDIDQLHFGFDGNIVCTRCSTEFHPYLNFSFGYPYLKAAIDRAEPSSLLCDPARVPLLWKADLNFIEREYLDWILRDPAGLHMITWPWYQVRFLAILLTEYCMKNGNSKVAVIRDLDEHMPDPRIIPALSIPEVFEQMIFFEIPPVCPIELRREVNKKDMKSLIFCLNTVVNIKLRRFGDGEIRERICHESMIKTENAVKKEVGLGNIRSITKKMMNGREAQIYLNIDENINPERVEKKRWDVTLTQREEWSGDTARTGSLKYPGEWLGAVISNVDNINKVTDAIKYRKYVSYYDNVIDPASNLHLISSNLEPEQIFSLVRKISPSLVIVENTDHLINDVRSKYREYSRELLNYLQSPARTVLLFSTMPEWRHFYNLDREETIFHSIPIAVHTVDTPQVLHLIRQFPDWDTQSRYPNPFTSMIKETLEHRTKVITPLFEEVPILTEFRDTVIANCKNIHDELSLIIPFYLRRVLLSPLNIIGGGIHDPRFLSPVWMQEADQSFTLDLIHTLLFLAAERGEIPSELPDIIREAFHSVYLPGGSPQNPLREQYFVKAGEYLCRDTDAHVIFVVNPQDVKGFLRLINENEVLTDAQQSRISVSTWKNLRDEEMDLQDSREQDNRRTYVISSQYPSLQYSLRESTVKQFIFISDLDSKKKIEEIINYRLLERLSFPILQPAEGWDMPSFLRETIDQITIPPVDRIEDIYRDFDDEVFQSPAYKSGNRNYREIIEGTVSAENQKRSIIEAGEKIFLFTDLMDRAVFIPRGESLMIRSGDFYSEITLEEKKTIARLENELLNKDILLNRSGLLLSFREILFRFMIEHCNRRPFRRGIYSWRNFEELYYDSISWRLLIGKAIIECQKQHLHDAEDIIFRMITGTGTTAQEKSTVLGWVKKYKEIVIQGRHYRLYYTERPSRPEDMDGIIAALSEVLPPDDLINANPDRIYKAVLMLQHFRNQVFDVSLTTPTILIIRSKLKRDMRTILSDTDTFSPHTIRRVVLKRSVEPMRIMQDYQQFIK